MFRRLCALSFAAALAACSSSSNESGSNISVHNGQAVTDRNDPVFQSTVALLANGRSFCTGTLIAPNVVVSAAHCFEGMEDDLRRVGVKIGFGAGPRYEAALTVKEVRYHKAFGLSTMQREAQQRWAQENQSVFNELVALAERQENGEDLSDAEIARAKEIARMMTAYVMPILNNPPRPINDISVLKFEGQIPSWARPAALALDGEVAAGTTVVGAGFGLTAEDGTGISGVLHKTNLRLDTVNANGKEVRTATDEGRDTCKGDSGGPLYVRGENGVRVLGATSRATGPGDCGTVGSIATDVRGHKAWLTCQQAAFNGQNAAGCSPDSATVINMTRPVGNVAGCLTRDETLLLLSFELAIRDGEQLSPTERQRHRALSARYEQFGACRR